MPNSKHDLPTPVMNPGEESGIAVPRVVAHIAGEAVPEPPHVKNVDNDILGVGRPSTEVERAAGLLTKFGFLVVFAAAILGGSGVGMTVLWAANQNMVAQTLKAHTDQNKQLWEDLRERDKIYREDRRETDRQHREDQSKVWTSQREQTAAIREQTRVMEETHATMRKTQDFMSAQVVTIEKLLKKVEKP